MSCIPVSRDSDGSTAWSSNHTLRDPAIDRELQDLSIAASLQDWSHSRTKRVIDVVISSLVLLIFGLSALLIALMIRLTSKGPAIYVQKRVGRNGKLFTMYKFRTMRIDCTGPTLTRDDDNRITLIGRWLRRFKLDELPQFYNVLCGDMSLIGPRPKLPQYAEILDRPYRPGITGAATLAFRREEELLRRIPTSELETFYGARIKPLKTLIDTRYMRYGTFSSDMRLVLATFVTCIGPCNLSKRVVSALCLNIPTHIIEQVAIKPDRNPGTLISTSVDPTQEVAQT